MRDRKIVAYLDGLPIEEEDPGFLEDFCMPSDEELDWMFGSEMADRMRSPRRRCIRFELEMLKLQFGKRNSTRTFRPAPLI